MLSIPYRGNPTTMAPKAPGAEVDYEFDWTKWLDGDTISTSSWTVPSGITKEKDSKDDKTTTIWLSGGTVGERYTITNTIVTAAGRTQARSMLIPVQVM